MKFVKISFLILVIFLLPVIVGAQQPPVKTYQVGSAVDDIALSQDGSVMAVAAGRLYLFNTLQGKLWDAWEGQKVAISLDGSYIVLASSDTIRYLYRDGRVLWTDNRWKPVQDISMTGQGDWIAVATDVRLLRISNAGSAPYLRSAINPTTISISQDGLVYAAGEKDGAINTVEVYRENNRLWNRTVDGEIQRVLVSHAKKSIIVASGNDVFQYYVNGTLKWRRETSEKIQDISISTDDAYIAAASQDKNIYLFDMNGTTVWRYPLETVPLRIALSAQGSYLASGSYNRLQILNRTGNLVWDFPVPDGLSQIALSEDERYCAVGTYGGSIFVFNMSTVPQLVTGHSSATPAVPTPTQQIWITPPTHIPSSPVTTPQSGLSPLTGIPVIIAALMVYRHMIRR